MPTQALLPILLLCVLLLQAQGGLFNRNKKPITWPNTDIKACEKNVFQDMCRRHCEDYRDCQENNICCLAYCGNICMNTL
ncbi:WAP four-disulfide core domain protein 10A [Molossus molossus]|uniref:WAP four-disulfide core domain 10A n=1 Tax=Molossus molossus TaxID=27622 RepID=A0A7J8HL75_MOLMO|nr:WAP four-disulfide core domain protein 10A [Molossus molossus]KAF6472888.1 WAP four-disulfide core domain 10A [Molossus molossus]